jgi:hypothetical protein
VEKWKMKNTHDVSANTLLINGKRLHRELHPVEAGRLPDEIGRKVVRALRGNTFCPPKLETNLVGNIVGNLDDMAHAFPGFVQFAGVPQPQLIPNSQAHLPTLQLGQTEPRHALLIQPKVPPDRDIGLRLALLEALVVVSLDLDEGPEDVLVLVRVLVAQQNRLRLVVHAGLLEVFEGGVGVVAPEIFEAVDLGEGDLAGAQLLGLAGGLDEPRQEGAIVDEGSPEGGVPGNILGYGSAGLPRREFSKVT